MAIPHTSPALFLKRTFQWSPRCGLSLMEMAIVMGIIGVVLGGIFVAALNISNTNKMTLMMKEIVQINQGVRSLYSQGTLPSGDITRIMYNAKVFPVNMTAVTCTSSAWEPCINHPWGGQVTMSSNFGAWGGSPKNSRAFEIVLWTVPAQVCTQLLQELVASASINGLIWAYSDVGNGFYVTSAVTSTSPFITKCAQDAKIYPTLNMVLEFHI